MPKVAQFDRNNIVFFCTNDMIGKHNWTRSVIDWPPQGPDLKVIEAAWDHLEIEMTRKLV